MGRQEQGISFESKEKIGPGEMFFLGEPIIKHPLVEDHLRKFTIPKGSEAWAFNIANRHYSEIEEEHATADEYLDVAQALLRNNVDFRFIGAHDDLIDIQLALGMNQVLGIKGVRWFKEIPPNLTCFPRDILVDFDGKIAVNPDANIQPNNSSMVVSRMGEGGAVLKEGRKVLTVNPGSYKKDVRPSYEKSVREIRKGYNVGFMPWSIAVNVDAEKRTVEDVFPTPHIDRVSAFMRGRDGKDYFIAESSYADSHVPSIGSYWQNIKQTCKDMNIVPEVVERGEDDSPCSLNLHQFRDGSVFMTKGHKALEDLVKQIVGTDKVFTTSKPLVIYPIVRQGGIRCMTLSAPRTMFKSQV